MPGAAVIALGSFLAQNASNFAQTKAVRKYGLRTLSVMLAKAEEAAKEASKMNNPGGTSVLSDVAIQLLEDKRNQLNLMAATIGVTEFSGTFRTKSDVVVFLEWINSIVKGIKVTSQDAVAQAIGDEGGSFDPDDFPILPESILTGDNQDMWNKIGAYQALAGDGALQFPKKAASDANDTFVTGNVSREKKRAASQFLSKWDGKDPLNQIADFSPAIVPWVQPLQTTSRVGAYIPGNVTTFLTMSDVDGGVINCQIPDKAYYASDFGDCLPVTLSVDNQVTEEAISFGGYFTDSEANVESARKTTIFSGVSETGISSINNSFNSPLSDFFTRTDQLEHYLHVSIRPHWQRADAPGTLLEEYTAVTYVLVRFEDHTATEGFVYGASGSTIGQAGTMTSNLKIPLGPLMKRRSLTGNDFSLWTMTKYYVDRTATDTDVYVLHHDATAHISSQSFRQLSTSELSNYNELTKSWSLVNPAVGLNSYVGGVSQSNDGEPSSTLWAYLNNHPASRKFTGAMRQLRNVEVAKLVPNYIAAGRPVPDRSEIENIHWWFSSRRVYDVMTADEATALRLDWSNLLNKYFRRVMTCRNLLETGPSTPNDF
jgi:hypothetical protein